MRETTAGVETLLLRRHTAVQFAGGMWVFPGGCIDDGDFASGTDPIAAAKAAVAYAKGNDKLVILGGAMGKTVLDAKGVKALAELPSLDELRAKLIGLLNAPATKIARTVKEPGAKLARVIQAKAAKSEAA